MKISVNWLKELLPIKWSAEQMIEKLGSLGFPAESVTNTGVDVEKVVAARILSVDKHPNADRLQIAKVNDGKGERQIVCGAPNIAPGQVVPLALPGASLKGGLQIAVSKIRGIESSGMLCSERELGLSESHAGIMQLSADAPLGKELRDILGADTVVDLEVTPNRPDVLSHVGVARELSALTGTKIKSTRSIWKSRTQGNTCKISIQEPLLCQRYLGKIFLNVKIGPSPRWMVERLTSCGIRPINNIVDITNYVLLEWGHPLHAFDLEKLAGGEIRVRKANAGEKFLALDEKTYELNANDLVIADAEKAVAIAGIMGGQDTGVTDSTTTILLESAVFDPLTVRKTSKRLGLKSESSIRFEKGTDTATAEAASLRAAQLIMELGQGKAGRALDVYPRKSKPVTIELNAKRLENLIGQSFPAKTVESILTRFELRPKKSAGGWHCTVPAYRKDLTQDVDLIEEVVRITGYASVPETLAPLATNKIPDGFLPPNIQPVIETLKGVGITETMTSSFCSLGSAEKFGFGQNDLVMLQNALDQNEAYMRPSVVLTLLQALERNLNFQRESVGLFEAGRRYTVKNNAVVENRTLGLVWYGGRREKNVHDSARDLDIYDLKGLLEALGIKIIFNAISPILHPNQSFELQMYGQRIGWAGLVHPAVAHELGHRRPCLLAEWNLDAYKISAKHTQAAGLPRFPFVERDLAIIIDEAQSWAKIEKTAREAAGPTLKSIRPFDIYTGESLGAGKKSLAFRLKFQREDKTLSDADINDALNRVKQALEQHCGAHLR